MEWCLSTTKWGGEGWGGEDPVLIFGPFNSMLERDTYSKGTLGQNEVLEATTRMLCDFVMDCSRQDSQKGGGIPEE